MRTALETDGTFAYVARQVDLDVARQVEDLHLAGIGSLSAPKRYYPAGALASSVLGFVGIDGTGLAGLEQQFETELAGTPGERTIEVAPDGQPIAQGINAETDPVDGVSLRTTIDRDIQFQTQQALASAVLDNGAKAGTVIVMVPRTGDILAMASFPSFDPNMFADTDPDRWRNRTVTDAFEPGSVNKIITAAAALESGAVSLTQRFQVPASMQVDQYTIHDSHPHPVETMTLSDIIAESSNIGIAKVAGVIGKTTLASYMNRFGFGRTTGPRVPG